MKRLFILLFTFVCLSVHSQQVKPETDAISGLKFIPGMYDVVRGLLYQHAVYPEKEYLEGITDTLELQMTADTKGVLTYKILKSKYPAFTKAVEEAFSQVPKDRMKFGPVYGTDNKAVINTEIIKFVFNEKNIYPPMKTYATLDRCKKYASDKDKNNRCVNERVQSFILQNLKMPNEVFQSSIGRQNRILLNAKIDQKGTTYEVMNKNADPYMIEATLEAFKKFPGFIPGVDIKGDILTQYQIIPVVFDIPNK